MLPVNLLTNNGINRSGFGLIVLWLDAEVLYMCWGWGGKLGVWYDFKNRDVRLCDYDSSHTQDFATLYFPIRCKLNERYTVHSKELS